MVLLTALLVAVVAAGLAALAVGVLLQARLRREADSDRQAAVEAAVAAATERAAHALAAERTDTLRAAVDTATEIASSKLGDALSAGGRELDLRSRSFEAQVDHIGQALQTVGTLVADLQKERAAQSGSLLAELANVTATQQRLAEHTDHLRQALANPKQRGQWGERMADDVLAAAGFEEGISFRRQTAIDGGTVPDFTFLLPQDLELRMDVKFPIDNYLRHLEAATDDERAKHTRAFVRDVRNRIRELAKRDYVDARDTVDCMVLFIPNEAVYAFLHDHDPEVIDVAMAHQVVLCSPSTLFAVLAVVRRSVEQFRLARTSDEILRCLGGVTGEWTKLGESLDKVKRQLDTVNRSFNDELNGTRRRMLQRQLDDIDALRSRPTVPPTGSGEALVAQKAAGDVRPLPQADRPAATSPGDGHDGRDVPEAG